MSSLRFEFESIFLKALKRKVRNGSIRLLKVYIQLVRGLRSVTMMVMILSAVTTMCVTGFFILVIGVVGLLPLSRENFFITLIAMGGALFVMCGTLLWAFFREKNWLEHAKVSELMVLALNNEWVAPKKRPPLEEPIKSVYN